MFAPPLCVRFLMAQKFVNTTFFTDKVVLLFQFCNTDMQVPPKLSVIKPRIKGVLEMHVQAFFFVFFCFFGHVVLTT